MAERKEAGMSDEDLFVVPYDPDDETFETVDWRANAYEVLERVSGLLRPHHLVVMLADSRSDEYPFKIVQRPGLGGQPDGGGNSGVIGQPMLVWNAKTKGWHVLGEDGTRFELVASHV